jgi:hydroxymethylglutaryl-CoA lyase
MATERGRCAAGIDTGIDLDQLVEAGQFISDFLGRKAQFACGNY